MATRPGRGPVSLITGLTWMIARGLKGKEVEPVNANAVPDTTPRRKVSRELLYEHLETYMQAEKRGKELIANCPVDQKTTYRMYQEMTNKARAMKEAIEHLLLVIDGRLPKEGGI